MLDDIFIEAKANEVILELNIVSAPVDLELVAKEKNLILNPKPEHMGTESGHLIRTGEDYIILYAQHIDNIGFQRFSIAHEIGHFVLDGHMEALFANSDKHTSRSPFSSNNRFEIEADKFASALLMPQTIFAKETRKIADGIKGILEISNLFQVSIVAAARRYVKLSKNNIVAIFSSNNIINYFEISEGFKEIKCEWPRPGQQIPTDTLTRNFERSSKNFIESEGSMYDWFSKKENNYTLTEQVMSLGDTGQILTILICEENEDDVEDDTYSYYTRY